jgi:hypothetical protein
MQSYQPRKFYSLRADANALGGFLEEPFQKIIPTLAPVSLPPVGGVATARSEAFNLDEIVSCSSASTRVSGREENADGSISILVAATIEGLNLLEVVTAERIVAQVSISLSSDNRPLRFSLAGCCFEGLRLAGHDRRPKLNPLLQRATGDDSHELPLTWQHVQQIGQGQAARVISGFQGRQGAEWATTRHGWMSGPHRREEGPALCSLVDGFEGVGLGEGGHIVEIPGFGRVIVGELVVSRNSVQLAAVRVDLGCPVKGKIGVNAVGGGGGTEN